MQKGLLKITLQRGVKFSNRACTPIFIRHLLLAVHAKGTSTGRLLQQMEHQAMNHWYPCCFPTSDATKVTLWLGTLEALLQ